jgi:urease accessory protein
VFRRCVAEAPADVNGAIAAGVVVGLFVITGLFHGYALGESIVGAEPTPLVSYFVGLAAIQSLIALVAFKLARLVMAPGAAPWVLRATGAAVAVVGVIGLLGQFTGGA